MILIQVPLVMGFVLVHLFAGELRFLHGIPRSRWLSLGGGISVAYVFMHIFPELDRAQRKIVDGSGFIPVIEHHAYLVALGGLIVFYGLERIVKTSQRRGENDTGGGKNITRAGMSVFWLHILSFALYNALIGYLLVHREEQDMRGLLFFSVAMALHFLVNDYGLRQDHKDTYKQKGRWVLVAAILMGWGAGLATTVSGAAIAVLFAFLAGGIVLNVLKEELPEERESRFLYFAGGAVVYTALLLFF